MLEERHRLPDQELDVFIPYLKDDEVVALGPLRHGMGDGLPEPMGMSGGGYWQPNLALKSEIWNPEYYSLIAIQSRWWGRGRYLQGTQIIHWLRLLWEQQPELRADLEAAFPDHNVTREGDKQIDGLLLPAVVYAGEGRGAPETQ